jgi:putative DNA primase/helicase
MWRADIGRTLTPAEEAAHRDKLATLRRERVAVDVKHRAETQTRAAAIWQAAPPAPDDHAYLTRKGIKAHGAKLYQGKLVIPMRADGVLHSLQFIGVDGGKRFLTGGRVGGCYFSIGDTRGVEALCIAEGFATGATIHEATAGCGGFQRWQLAGGGEGNAGETDLPRSCARTMTATRATGLTKATEAGAVAGGLLVIQSLWGDGEPGRL